MRRLILLVLVAAGLWASYWIIGATAKEKVIAAWLADRRAEGWVADYTAIDVQGFPNRFDTTLSGLELADPETGVAWSAPFFQVLALSYQPTHIIAVWPQEQVISAPDGRVTVSSKDMRGSVVFASTTSLALRRANFVLEDFGLQSSAGWSSHVQTARLATKEVVGKENFHDIGFEAEMLRPAATLRARLDPTGVLPEHLSKLRLDGELGFDAPWDRAAIEDRRPNLTHVKLRDMRATWGELDLRLVGEVAVDREGYPTGSITVKATNWREMVAMAVAAGALPAAMAGTVEGALSLVAQMSGNPDSIDAPLTIANRVISFGFIPLGDAPRLRLR